MQVHSSFQAEGNLMFGKNQNWESCQVECHSDSSSDGYYSCEDSLPACQIDCAEFQHQRYFDELFKALVQQRVEIKEAQKKTEARLLTITKLASNVIDRFVDPQSPYHEEGLNAVTLRSGTQLKGPTISCQNVVPTTHADIDLQRDVICEEEILVKKKVTIPIINGRTVDPKNPTSLPYPITTKKARKTKTTDPHVIELLKKWK
ncbi:hypothetical protein PIB30_080267 [Stylosanthes scabra]|uniref:Uncharacterized protein n=1 Tax=Stylosanthes scabra TaxID=79078 RepID=A0ABU6YQ73_9FABA|nr:hypothetical protein [Stylosanthes scabra]